MKFFVGTVLILAAVLYGSDAKRIVGGSTASISEFPGIVQLERGWNFIWSQMCAGNVLTTRYFVTGASCLTDLLPIYERRIRAGATFRGIGGTVIDVQETILHPNYNRNTQEGDIAVVLLAEPLTYSQNIQPTTVVAPGFEMPDNLPVTLAGWGNSEINGAAALVLQKASVLTVNHATCAERYAQLQPPATVIDTMICAGLLDVGGVDGCQGDGGGPLIADDILIGLISWGHGCANATYPGVYTKVSAYTDWIIETIG